jgi:hypothetical protein
MLNAIAGFFGKRKATEVNAKTVYRAGLNRLASGSDLGPADRPKFEQALEELGYDQATVEGHLAAVRRVFDLRRERSGLEKQGIDPAAAAERIRELEEKHRPAREAMDEAERQAELAYHAEFARQRRAQNIDAEIERITTPLAGIAFETPAPYRPEAKVDPFADPAKVKRIVALVKARLDSPVTTAAGVSLEEAQSLGIAANSIVAWAEQAAYSRDRVKFWTATNNANRTEERRVARVEVRRIAQQLPWLVAAGVIAADVPAEQPTGPTLALAAG